MSLSVRIKTVATDLETIKRMCHQCGWGDVVFGERWDRMQKRLVKDENSIRFSIHPKQHPTWTNQISLDVRTGEATYDGDFGELKKCANRISQEYEAASITLAAEKEGWAWERGVNAEGVPTVTVSYPEEELVQEASYE